MTTLAAPRPPVKATSAPVAPRAPQIRPLTLRIARPQARLKQLHSRYTERVWTYDEPASTEEESRAYFRRHVEMNRESDAEGTYHVHASRFYLGSLSADRRPRFALSLLGYWLDNRPELCPFDDPTGTSAAWIEGPRGEDVSVFRHGRLIAVFRMVDGRYRLARTDDLIPPERPSRVLPDWLATRVPAYRPDDAEPGPYTPYGADRSTAATDEEMFPQGRD